MVQRSAEVEANPLWRLMREHGIKRAQAAELLHVSVHTITAWLSPSTARKASDYPQWAYELLTYKLNERAKISQAVPKGRPIPPAVSTDSYGSGIPRIDELWERGK